MESLPIDLQIDILICLPLERLIACTEVCKKWNILIRGEYFKKCYLVRSMTTPMEPTPYSMVYSAYQNENRLLARPQQRFTFPSLYGYAMSAPIRGWICLQSPTKFVLCNPITNKFVPLPGFEGSMVLFYLTCVFGYDEATNVYKVIRTRSVDQHLVYTVGGERSWTPIACESDMPLTSALCKGGVLYYGAITVPDVTPIIMSFNVNSEDFIIIPLPEEFNIDRLNAKMVNYNGKVSLVNNTAMELDRSGGFQICARDDISGEWRVERIEIPKWKENAGKMLFSFVGTIGTAGELVFTHVSLREGSQDVLYYNPNTTQQNKFKKFEIEAVNGGSYHYVRTCLNHFHSLLRT